MTPDRYREDADELDYTEPRLGDSVAPIWAYSQPVPGGQITSIDGDLVTVTDRNGNLWQAHARNITITHRDGRPFNADERERWDEATERAAYLRDVLTKAEREFHGG